MTRYGLFASVVLGGALLGRLDALLPRLRSLRPSLESGPTPLVEPVLALLDELSDPPGLIGEFLECAGQQRYRVDSIRMALNINERSLQRATSRWLGMSPKAYLRLTRARAAHAQLLAGAPVLEVSGELGFSDQAHLTRELKAILGVTPARVSGSFKTLAPHVR